MSRFSSSTRFTFEPVAQGIDLVTVGTNYTTPVILRERLNSLALVQAVRGTARFHLEHDSTQGEAVVRLTDGVTNLVENTISLATSPATFNQPVDVTKVAGSAGLFWEVEVTSAGTAASTGRMIADLTAETPLFVSAGQC